MKAIDPHTLVDARPDPVSVKPRPDAPVAPRIARQRLDFMGVVRGLIVVYVMIYLMLYIAEPDLNVPHWVDMLALNGGMGITLFFVVSAFSLHDTMPLRLTWPRP